MKKEESFGSEINIERLLRKQEKLFRENEIYSRLLFLPITVIVVSFSIIAYNFTVGKVPSEYGIVANYEKEVVQESEPVKTVESELLNLNTATVQQLDALPGIGEKKAAAIVKLRDEMGGFFSVEDILNVEGIGEKILSEIRSRVFVEPK
ncbi:MAG: ComEA family DNA-binding protein [Clostridia bacterium]|nr:ComEA family DNA-binding protein [Clostridia bacterium]